MPTQPSAASALSDLCILLDTIRDAARASSQPFPWTITEIAEGDKGYMVRLVHRQTRATVAFSAYWTRSYEVFDALEG